MVELLYSPQADDTLDTLEADATRTSLVQKINDALDLLESDPGSALCRRKRFALVDLWGMPVIDRGEEWLILWELTSSEAVLIHAIVPAP